MVVYIRDVSTREIDAQWWCTYVMSEIYRILAQKDLFVVWPQRSLLLVWVLYQQREDV